MKRKILKISYELFLALFMKGIHPSYFVSHNEVPCDAKIIDIRVNVFENPNTIDVLIESEAFPELKSGESYPYLIPTIASIYQDKTKNC